MAGGTLNRVPEVVYAALADKIEFRDGVPYWTDGRPAGSVNGDGYREVRCTLDGVRIRVKSYRLQWFKVYGTLPDYIDHANGRKDDDRLENLREATHSQNMRNRIKKKGASRFIGVYFDESRRKQWRATYNVNGRQKKLGSFRTEEEAAAARDRAVVENGYATWSPLNFPASETI